MSSSLAPSAPGSPAGRTDLALYATLVVVWGTSWISIRYQLGVVSPAVSLLWRFVLAAALCWAIALWRGEAMRFPIRRHLWFALAGVLLFSTNFLMFYMAGAYVPSGLLAVVFALASPVNLALAALFFRRPVERRVLAGAAVGIAGVALLYAPEILGHAFDAAAFAGLALAVAGTLSFCLGNMAMSVIQQAGVSDYAATAWGMTYSVLWLLAICLVSGAEFTIDLSAHYLIALVWLAAGASVAAFIAYLALIKRVGPGRAGFATVLFPVVALAISSVFENYDWTPLALAGLALVAAGNVLVLGLFRRRA